MESMNQLSKTSCYGDGEMIAYLKSLPNDVKHRVRALKKLQLGVIQAETKFYERIHKIETEFLPLFHTLYEKRKQIVTGEYEPTKEEANIRIIHGMTEEQEMEIDADSVKDTPETTKGIPDFWLQVLKESEDITDMIQDHDEPILRHLIDITCELSSSPHKFTLHFHFSPNEYFNETVLTKTYNLQMGPDEDDPFSYDGPIVVGAHGTKITWNEGKDVTKKVIKKKQKKGSNAGRFVPRVVDADSFFNFFNCDYIKGHSSIDFDDNTRELMASDFEIGQYFRDQVIPRAVLFFTGEMGNDSMEEFDDVEDEDDEEDDDEESDAVDDAESDRN